MSEMEHRPMSEQREAEIRSYFKAFDGLTQGNASEIFNEVHRLRQESEAKEKAAGVKITMTPEALNDYRRRAPGLVLASEQLAEREAKAVAMVGKCEWVGRMGGDYCPNCAGEIHIGHQEGCELSAILEDAKNAE